MNISNLTDADDFKIFKIFFREQRGDARLRPALLSLFAGSQQLHYYINQDNNLFKYKFRIKLI